MDTLRIGIEYARIKHAKQVLQYDLSFVYYPSFQNRLDEVFDRDGGEFQGLGIKAFKRR